MPAQLARAAQLGLLAKDLAAARVRRSGPARDRVVRQIIQRLGLMHGLPQKIGQILSFAEFDGADRRFTCLTENIPTLPAEEAFAEFERQTGRPITAAFREISADGISASMGQVHRAVLQDGREVAVKIQYPGLAEQVQADLRALGWLTGPLGDLRRGFDLAGYRAEIGSMLEAELDYTQEAQAQKRFARRTATWDGVRVPEVIDELSGRGVLTMTWLEGGRLADARAWPDADRRALSRTLLKLFLSGCFEWGEVHADPHQGNYRFARRADGSVEVGILDFGCVKEIESSLANGWREMISRVMRDDCDAEGMGACFEKMGFDMDQLLPLRPKLAEIAAILLEPFRHSGPFDLTHWRVGERLASVLGEHRMAFRTAGPPSMLFLVRAFQGLIFQLKLLNAPVNWRQLFQECNAQPCSETTHEEKGSALQSLASSRVNLTATARVSSPKQILPSHVQNFSCISSFRGSELVPIEGLEPTATMRSDRLQIRVLDGTSTKVALTFGAGATDSLPDLVPADLHDKLRERRIDLPAIAARARGSGYQPGELFSLQDGPKTVRVWLE